MAPAPAWIITSLAMVALYALGLRVSVSAVTGRTGASNTFGKALLVSAGLTLLSMALPLWLPHPVAASLVMLAIWAGVVRWSYQLEWLQTGLVAALMLVLALGALALLSMLLRGAAF